MRILNKEMCPGVVIHWARVGERAEVHLRVNRLDFTYYKEGARGGIIDVEPNVEIGYNPEWIAVARFLAGIVANEAISAMRARIPLDMACVRAIVDASSPIDCGDKHLELYFWDAEVVAAAVAAACPVTLVLEGGD